MTLSVELDAVGVALRVAAAIEKAGGTYFVGGSLASSVQGEPRATNDVDIVIRLQRSKVHDFIDALGSDFEVDAESLRQALLSGTSCNIFYLPLLTKVDLFGIGSTPYDQVEFSRRGPIIVREPGVALVVKSPEDTVLRKLWWFRQGGEVSERQWRDVIQVLRFSGRDMDSGYLNEWARYLRVEDLLLRAIEEAG